MIRNESVNFSAAEISIIVHATEEKDKILEHFSSTLSVSPDSFSTGFAEGHWGNKIVLLTSILSKNEANSLYVKIKSCLPIRMSHYFQISLISMTRREICT